MGEVRIFTTKNTKVKLFVYSFVPLCDLRGDSFSPPLLPLRMCLFVFTCPQVMGVVEKILSPPAAIYCP
jgi:hypothetical protein